MKRKEREYARGYLAGRQECAELMDVKNRYVNELEAVLREAATDWEVGPGPFTVSLPTVNKIINLRHGVYQEHWKPLVLGPNTIHGGWDKP